MKKSVFVFGESGRMGQEVIRIVKSSQHLEYAGGYSNDNPSTDVTKSPDIVIDFSLPATLPTLCDFIKIHKSCLISGTTGFTENQVSDFKDLGKVAPIFWSANMSFGIYLMCKLSEDLAKYDKYFSYSIEDTHHVHKKDKPSGTAIIIENAAKKSTSKIAPIISHREGEVFGIHSFIAESANEKLEIKHEAFNRGLFAQGAVDVSTWLSEKAPGVYSMDDFFKDL